MAPARRVAVRVGAATWQEEVERFAPRSLSRAAADRERRRLEQDDLNVTDRQPCEAVGLTARDLRAS